MSGLLAWLGPAYLLAMAAVYLGLAARRPALARAGIATGSRSLRSVAPTLLSIFALIGLFEVFVPPRLIDQWMGAGSGIGPLLVGTAAGSIAAGSPAAAYPAAGSLLASGAAIGAVGAFVSAWVLVGVVTLPFEAQQFGWRFALLRNGGSVLAAVLIGALIGWIL